jgi:hypothetical protein
MVAIAPNRFGARDAQPLDSYFGSAKDVLQGLFGDNGNKDMPPFAQAAIEQTARIRAIAARKFGDAEGEELLEALCDATLRRPTFITQMNMPPDQVLAIGQFREGMGAAVFLLLAWIAEGRSEQPPQREGSHAKSTRERKPRRAAPKPKRKR